MLAAISKMVQFNLEEMKNSKKKVYMKMLGKETYDMKAWILSKEYYKRRVYL